MIQDSCNMNKLVVSKASSMVGLKKFITHTSTYLNLLFLEKKSSFFKNRNTKRSFTHLPGNLKSKSGRKITAMTYLVIMPLSNSWKCLHRQTFFLIFKTSSIIRTYSSTDIDLSLLIFRKGNFPSEEGTPTKAELKQNIFQVYLISRSYSWNTTSNAQQ